MDFMKRFDMLLKVDYENPLGKGYWSADERKEV